MNFNLVSPVGSKNGNSFTIPINDTITIPANALVNMNFANISRKANLVLDNDESITFTPLGVFPKVYPSHVDSPNNPFYDQHNGTEYNVAIIPKGIYTFSEFVIAVNFAINVMMGLGRATSYVSNPLNSQVREPDAIYEMGVGLELSDTATFTFFDGIGAWEGSTIDYFNEAQGANANDYEKLGGTDGTFDSYIMNEVHYWHWMADDKNDPYTVLSRNLIHAKTIQNYGDLVGKVCIGLYGKEYSVGLPTPATAPVRTEGNATPKLVPISGVASLNVPAMFISLVITNTSVRILMAQSGTEDLKNWDRPNKEITHMKQLAFITGSPFSRSVDNPIDVYFQTYIRFKDTNLEKPNLYFRVRGLDNEIIYDSVIDNEYIPFSFIESPNLTYNNANLINSQIPFNVMCSATHAGEGFSNIYPVGLDKDANGATGSMPNSIIRQYTMTMTSRLAEVFGIQTSRFLNPNSQENDLTQILLRDLTIGWAKISYTVLVENLPFGNYKNNEEGRAVASKKNILATIPSPFISGDVSNINGEDQLIITTYQPYNPITSSLINKNPLVINNWNIRIINTLTDEPATQIEQVILNFTITDPRKLNIVL